MPVIAAVNRFTLKGAEAVGHFSDGTPAIAVQRHGQGSAMYCGFLPSLSYFKPAIPRRPVDNGSHDGAMNHFIPTQFDSAAANLIAMPLASLSLPVECSRPLVANGVIQSDSATVIPLINWSAGPIKDLTVTVKIPTPKGHAALATGGELGVSEVGDTTIFTLDLDVADALILRSSVPKILTGSR